MNTKYTFKQEYTGFQGLNTSIPPSTITMEVNGELTLTQVLERFEEFLRGAGFHFDGHLDFINDEVTPEPDTNTFYVNTEAWSDCSSTTSTMSLPEEHSTYYYDHSRNK